MKCKTRTLGAEMIYLIRPAKKSPKKKQFLLQAFGLTRLSLMKAEFSIGELEVVKTQTPHLFDIYGAHE